MADVILFRPRDFPVSVPGGTMMPLGLIFVATPLVAQGLSVKIIDTGTCPDWERELHRHIDASTICAGVGAMTGYQIKNGLEFSAKLKHIKKIPIVWGGLHPSILPEQTLQHPLVDIVVIGEGEEKFREIVYRLRHNLPLDDIAGIGYKNGTTVKFTPACNEFLDLDELAFPAYELIDMEHCLNHNLSHELLPEPGRIIDMSMHRGCPNRCTFCYNLEFNKRSWRAMSPSTMLDHLTEAKSRYNIDAVNFLSDNFFVNETNVREFCRGLIDRNLGIVWHADMRIDTFLRYDHDLIDLIRRSGCTAIGFGIESGSDRMLKLIHKDVSVAEVRKAHEKIRQYKFHVHDQFLIGIPDETIEDVRQTMQLIRELARHERVHIHGPNMYVPYPGTPLYNRSIELGFRPPQSLDAWSEYDWSLKSNLPFFTKKYRNFIREATYFSPEVRISPVKSNLLSTMFQRYRMLRLAGIIRGIQLHNLDMRIFQMIKRLLTIPGTLFRRLPGNSVKTE